MPNSATLLQALGAAFCAILCALSGMGGGGMMIGARTAAWAKAGGGVPFLRLTPNGSVPPYNTRVTVSNDDNHVIIFKARIFNAPGTWSTICGNVGTSNNGGVNFRQYNAETNVMVYYSGTNTIRFSGWSEWNLSNGGIFVNGVKQPQAPMKDGLIITSPIIIGSYRTTSATNCTIDVQRFAISKNGQMVIDYVPHKSGTFLDLVSGELVTKAGSFDVAYMEETA